MVTYPETWSENTLGDLAHIQTGSRNNEEKTASGRYPFFVRSATIERINTYSYDEEAILVPGEGNIGSIFHYVSGKFDAHQRVYVIDQFRPGIFAPYLYWYMSKFFGSYALQNTVKATVDSLRLPTFQLFKVRYPEWGEQKAIARALNEFDDLLVDLDELIVKKKNIRDGALDELLSQNGPKQNRVRLSEIATVLNGDRGANYPSDKDFVMEGIPFVNAGHLTDGHIDFRQMNYITMERYSRLGGAQIRYGDTLLCLRGSIGKCAFSDVEYGAPASSLCIIRPNLSIVPRYLFLLMSSDLAESQIHDVTTGSSQPNLSAYDVTRFEFVVPDKDEQLATVNMVASLDEEIRVLEEERLKVENLKLGAMDDLLTGRVRLPVEEVVA